MDFTYDTYRELLETGLAADYDYLTVREYVTRRRQDDGRSAVDEEGRQPPDDERSTDPLPERFVVLRHDIDRKPWNALAKAEIEAEYGIESSYYVRTVDKTFVPEVVRTIADLGHEVGYHYEDLDRGDGDPTDAIASFESHLERVRDLVAVDTVCMHGNPLTPHDNRDLWDHASLDRFDLLGEAYLSMDFEDVTYFSDTGRTWQDGVLKIKDHTMGEGTKAVEADTTADLMAVLADHRVDRLCVLTHPNRWAGSYQEHLVESAKDTAVNVVKRGLAIVS
jgi:hypothetical protein